MRAFLFSVVLGAWMVAGTPLAAQWPGELRGDVVDARTGRSLSSVAVALLDGTLLTWTDSKGHFHFRGLPPGWVTVVFEGLGFGTETRRVRIRDGHIATLAIRLVADPIELQTVTASVQHRRPGVGFRLDRSAIRASGARTLGAALRAAPGLVVRTDRPGGGESVSIRGSTAGAVLVLVDGVPLNDPLTGVADLTAVQVASITSIEVLSGARSTAFGSGARAGVVLIRTGWDDPSWRLVGDVGSLGSRSFDAQAGHVGSGWSGSIGGVVRTVDGGFDFDQPKAVGGGAGTRENADGTQLGVRSSLDGRLRGGRLSLRVSLERDLRGLPGKSFLPSAQARSAARRARATIAWTRSNGGLRTAWTGFGQIARLRVVDTDPPVGLAFDTRSRVVEAGGRVSLSGSREGVLARWSLGASARSQWARSESLSDAAPVRRLNTFVSVGAESEPILGSSTRFSGALAVHRDPSAGRLRYTHALGIEWRRAEWYVILEQRSAFSPPSLSDQFFREGVAVAPNPSLQAERIASEFELAAGGSWMGRGWTVAVRAAAYDGDVQGMIVWAPDFRFVWSPRNIDVNRRGVDVSATGETRMGAGRLQVRLAYGLADVTYRRANPSQVLYRPRHSGAWGLTFSSDGWVFATETTLTGARYPVPSPINELPAFAITDVRLARSIPWGVRRVEISTHIRRLFNRRDNLIFGFPHPGRTIDISIGVQGFGTR